MLQNFSQLCSNKKAVPDFSPERLSNKNKGFVLYYILTNCKKLGKYRNMPLIFVLYLSIIPAKKQQKAGKSTCFNLLKTHVFTNVSAR